MSLATAQILVNTTSHASATTAPLCKYNFRFPTTTNTTSVECKRYRGHPCGNICHAILEGLPDRGHKLDRHRNFLKHTLFIPCSNPHHRFWRSMRYPELGLSPNRTWQYACTTNENYIFASLMYLLFVLQLILYFRCNIRYIYADVTSRQKLSHGEPLLIHAENGPFWPLNTSFAS